MENMKFKEDAVIYLMKKKTKLVVKPIPRSAQFTFSSKEKKPFLKD
jgi:hypothetical protein